MYGNRFTDVYHYLSSISTDGIVQYVKVFENVDKSKFKIRIDVDLENYVVTVTAPDGKIFKQDVREEENTKKAIIANEWYKKAKQSYDRFMSSGSSFATTYKE